MFTSIMHAVDKDIEELYENYVTHIFQLVYSIFS